jgi:hypothetical protein
MTPGGFMQAKLYFEARERRGSALIYVIVARAALIALCSLAVDLGRYEVAHSQGYNAAVSAARAGAAAMALSGSTAASVTTAATNTAINNSVDGQPITSGMVTVKFVKWDSATNTGTNESTANYSKANAVKVFISYNVPLVFAQVLGLSKKALVEHSTAEVVTAVDTPYVVATGNPWLAGEPSGTQGSQPDPGFTTTHGTEDHQYKYDIAGTPGNDTNGAAASAGTYGSYEPYTSPVQIAFTVTPGATITITNTSGTVSWDHDTTPFSDPTGNSGANGTSDDAASNGVAEHGIADVTMPLGAMVGVFLGSGLPDDIATPPPPLNFGTQAERDYVGLAPQLQQPFYVGTGQTSSSQQQEIVVPANATRMFIGIMDGWEWSNNNGGFNATVTQTNIVTVE